VPNISPRKKSPRKPRPRKHRRNRRKTGLSHKDQRSLTVEAGSEIERVCDMLEASQWFTKLAMQMREIEKGVPPEQRDEIARFAKLHFDFDIDRLTEQPWEMRIVGELPDAMIASARWRLERLERVLSWAVYEDK
jgi:hypothetical protein